MPSQELADYYRASDIAVWPRSVTTSILDAAACALPVIISDQVFAYTTYLQTDVEYQHQPNILAAKYKTNDADDLATELLKLEDSKLRAEVGDVVNIRVEQNSSWKAIANKRIKDYINL